MPTNLICVCAHSVLSSSLQPHRLQPTRLLCPWDFLGKNTGVGCCFFHQIFSTQGSSQLLLCLPKSSPKSIQLSKDLSHQIPQSTSLHPELLQGLLKVNSYSSMKLNLLQRQMANAFVVQLLAMLFISVNFSPLVTWLPCGHKSDHTLGGIS